MTVRQTSVKLGHGFSGPALSEYETWSLVALLASSWLPRPIDSRCKICTRSFLACLALVSMAPLSNGSGVLLIPGIVWSMAVSNSSSTSCSRIITAFSPMVSGELTMASLSICDIRLARLSMERPCALKTSCMPSNMYTCPLGLPLRPWTACSVRSNARLPAAPRRALSPRRTAAQDVESTSMFDAPPAPASTGSAAALVLALRAAAAACCSSVGGGGSSSRSATVPPAAASAASRCLADSAAFSFHSSRATLRLLAVLCIFWRVSFVHARDHSMTPCIRKRAR